MGRWGSLGLARRRLARDARLALRSPRARRRLLLSPVLFSVVVRWLAWLQAMLFLLWGGLAPDNVRYEPWLLLVTFGSLALYTLYIPVLRPALRPVFHGSRLAAVVEHGAPLAALDILVCLGVIWLSGGGGSPYLRFGITATILPSLRFGFPGAVASAGAFSLGYLAVMATTPLGQRQMSATPDTVIGSALDPWLVAAFCAYLATVLRGLAEESATTDRALRETDTLFDLACSVLPTAGEVDRFVVRVAEAVRASRLYASLAVEARGPAGPVRAGFGPEPEPGDWTLTLPLVVQGQPVGRVRFGGLGPGATPETADRLAHAIAAQIEVGLDHARLVRERADLAAQEERGRLARDIHDGIAQSLFMLTLSLEACVELAGRQGEDLRPRLALLLALSKQALWEVRHSIHDLKPMLAGDASLTSVLESQVREFRTITGIDAELHVEGEEPPSPPAVRAALYRITQEALANVFKHARARRVRIAVHYSPERVRLDVEDDGVGLPAEVASGDRRGFGLGNMRERAAEVGGTVTFANRAFAAGAGGLHLRADIPLAGAATARVGAPGDDG